MTLGELRKLLANLYSRPDWLLADTFPEEHITECEADDPVARIVDRFSLQRVDDEYDVLIQRTVTMRPMLDRIEFTVSVGGTTTTIEAEPAA